MNLLVAMPSLGNPELVERALGWTRYMSGLEPNVVVVDNGSSAELRALCRDNDWVWLTKWRNMSFSESLNTAASSMRTGWESSTHMLALNDDAIMTPEAVEAMVLHAMDGAEIVGHLLTEIGGTTVNHAGVGLLGGVPYHLGRGTDRSEHVECVEVPATTFAAVLVDLRLWERLEGLDEGYWYGYEDTDFCLRALEAGARPLLCCEGEAWHSEKTTRGGMDETPNQRRYVGKWLVTGRAVRAAEKWRLEDEHRGDPHGEDADVGSGG